MDINLIQKNFLEKINELTGLQCLKAVDLNKVNQKQLDKNRVISRILTMENGIEKYTSRESDDDFIYYKQSNVNKIYITFNFLSAYDDVDACHRFFNHIEGSEWWAARNSYSYVIQEVLEIVDISETLLGDYREKYSFDIIVRVIDETTEQIELVKDVEYDVEVN